MKKVVGIVAVLMLLITSIGYSQSLVTGDIKKDVNNLLPAGKRTVEIMSLKQDDRMAELSEKLQAAAQQDMEWFLNYGKSIPEGEAMPYHPKLGLTEEEYKEFLEGYMKGLSLKCDYTTQVVIQKKGDVIKFNTDETLPVLANILKGIEINLAKSMVTINKNKLPFIKVAGAHTDDNAFKSKWDGYLWEISEPDIKDANELLNQPEKYWIKSYKLTIGQIQKTGKTYLHAKEINMKYGVPLGSFETILMLSPITNN